MDDEQPGAGISLRIEDNEVHVRMTHPSETWIEMRLSRSETMQLANALEQAAARVVVPDMSSAIQRFRLIGGGKSDD